MKTVAVPVALDMPWEQFEPVAQILRDMGFDQVEWRDAATPPKPGASRNVEQLKKYGVEFTQIRRFELEVPDDMPLVWVRKMVRHALRDAGIDVEPGDPMTLE